MNKNKVDSLENFMIKIFNYDIETKKYDIPDFPQHLNDLQPFVTSYAAGQHFNKHHLGYIKKLNAFLTENNFSFKSPFELYNFLKDNSTNAPKLNEITLEHLLGGVVNHALFWNVLSSCTIQPSNNFEKKIEQQFKSFDLLESTIRHVGGQLIGSGWVWIVVVKENEQIKLKVCTTSNQQNCFVEKGVYPIMCIDLWEHAYYLDYLNDRNDYLDNILKVINWGQVEEYYDFFVEILNSI